MADPHATGVRVLQALQRGREKAIAMRREQLAVLRRLVAYEARRDAAAGYPEHGRAARIARRLSQAASRRTVYRVYAALPRVAQNSEKLSAEVKTP